MSDYFRKLLMREELSMIVRQAWIDRCKLKMIQKPEHEIPWERMDEFDRETDRVIGQAVATAVLGMNAADLETLTKLEG